MKPQECFSILRKVPILVVITNQGKSARILFHKNKMKDISKKVKPLSDRVLIREITNNKEKKTASGIIIPVTVTEDKGSKRGEIVSIGEGRFDSGDVIEMTVKVGDIVLFQWGDKLVIDDEDYYIVRESEILAVVK